MIHLPHLLHLYRYARGRLQKRRIYRSALDIAKAIFLSATTPDKPATHPPHWLKGLRLHLNHLPDPVYLRTANSDFLVLKEIFEDGEYAPILQWNLPVNATVLDLGGNIGLASLYFGRAFSKSRLVVVEPDAGNCDIIRKNCDGMIRAGRLRIVQAFAAARDGSAGIDRNARSWAFKMAEQSSANSCESIPCRSISSLIRDSGFEYIDLLKCDVEGAEAAMFADCKDWIGQVGHLVVETHAPYRNVELYQHLNNAGWAFDVLQESQEPKVGLCFLKRLHF